MMQFLLLFFICQQSFSASYACLACTLGVRHVEVIADYYEIPIEKVFEDACSIFPNDEKWKKWRMGCERIITIFGPLIVDLLEKGIGPDQVCREMGVCTKDQYQCTLYNDTNLETKKYLERKYATSDLYSYPEGQKPFTFSFDPPLPKVDADGDFFGADFYERGSAWRGKDCDDSDASIYPGRKTGGSSPSDYNCNGISGTNPQTSQSYEDELCGTVLRRGIVNFGDSASAHFRIPQQLMLPNVTVENLANILPMVMLEADWPHLGEYCGYMNDTTGLTPGRVSSAYLHSLNRNLCNHRDYQTIAVNGASSNNFHTLIQAFNRNKETDHPVLIFVAFIGDDICGSEHSFASMTDPQVFYNNIVSGLKEIDQMIPAQSKVVFIGLTEGTQLYQYLHDTVHPLGDFTYEQVYDYMNCLEVNPCWGWLNSNESIRMESQRIADSLSAQYPKIMENEKFENFDMHFIELTTLQEKMINDWIQEGGDPKALAEPFDGFHPSQLYQSTMADLIFKTLTNQDPDIYGEVNPNNDRIRSLFGDQGGY